MRKIPVPANRYTPLKENWMKIFTPIVDHLHLQIKFNLKTRMIEIRVIDNDFKDILIKFDFLQTSKQTTDISALQRAADFCRAFTLGFDVEDALALVRLDELFLESFEIQDGILLQQFFLYNLSILNI